MQGLPLMPRHSLALTLKIGKYTLLTALNATITCYVLDYDIDGSCSCFDTGIWNNHASSSDTGRRTFFRRSRCYHSVPNISSHFQSSDVHHPHVILLLFLPLPYRIGPVLKVIYGILLYLHCLTYRRLTSGICLLVSLSSNQTHVLYISKVPVAFIRSNLTLSCQPSFLVTFRLISDNNFLFASSGSTWHSFLGVILSLVTDLQSHLYACLQIHISKHTRPVYCAHCGYSCTQTIWPLTGSNQRFFAGAPHGSYFTKAQPSICLRVLLFAFVCVELTTTLAGWHTARHRWPFHFTPSIQGVLLRLYI